MGQVTEIYLRKVVAAVVSPSDGAEVLRSVGLDPQSQAEVGRMIDAETYYDALERIARGMADATDLPLRVGATMRCDDYGAFGLA